MPSTLDQFIFDVNYALASDSVFTLVRESDTNVIPPVEDDFLLLDGTNFLLLDGENLALL